MFLSLEKSKTVLALLSYNYMESKVCQEEYNLARALDEDPNYTTRLIEVKLDVVDIWPIWCTPKFAIDFTEEKLSSTRISQVINIIDFENGMCETKGLIAFFRTILILQFFVIWLGLIHLRCLPTRVE